MIVYISIPLVLILHGFLKRKKYSVISFIVIVYIAIVLCFGYTTGSDWRIYERAFNEFDFNNPLFIWEPGYIIYMGFFKLLGFSFWSFFIITKCVLFYICVFNIRKYSIVSFEIELFCFIALFGLFFFIDNPMRNLIAICLFTFSYKYLIERDIIKYYLVVLLCISFHVASILLLILYPLYQLKFGRNQLIILYLVFNFGLYFFADYFVTLLSSLTSFSPYISRKIAFYAENEQLEAQRLLSLGFIIQSVFFILVVYTKKKFFLLGPKGVFVYKITILYVMIYRLSATFGVFYRLQFFFSIIYSIGILACGCFLLTEKNRFIYKILLIVYVSLVGYGVLTASHKYIPYTNYLFFEKMDYSERSLYNYQYSPYLKD